jgi:drug/metabolite transporter (DMT)-like permease
VKNEETFSLGALSSASPSLLSDVAGGEQLTQRGWSAELAVMSSVIFASGGHLLIKAGLNHAARLNTGTTLWQRLGHYLLEPAVILGLGVYLLGTLLWVLAVSKKSISYLYPITALNYVLVSLGGTLFFGEVIPRAHWVGIFTVVCGVILMQRSESGESK